VARAKASKAATRILRKARERVAKVETVNPFKVFERDGWMCRLCGAATPRGKRGTHDDDAPELDHVIPLAKGGDHSYANTQCACRRCNGLKGDDPAWRPAPRGRVKSSEPLPS
jgi:5-methylcytosine-specific restriction endonuclease McrA